MGILETLGWMIAIIIIGGILFLVWAFSMVGNNQEKIAGFRSALANQFGSEDFFVALAPLRGFGIAWDRGCAVFAEEGKDTQLLPFDTVRDVRIDIDGVTVTEERSVTKTNRGSQLLGGAVGGALLGPVGLLAGGLSGSSTTTAKSIASENIKAIKLVLRTNDMTAPLRTFAFVETDYGPGQPASVLTDQLAKAQHYHALITNELEERQYRGIT